MTRTHLETDYLVVGSGAMGMAFVDTLLAETDANVIMVDKYPKPGGHWNVAYPFVTLHQPSAFYGVSSRELCKGRKDKIGLNKGMSELASGAEVSAYFDDVMKHDFLPSGRVQYFPLSEYTGDGEFHGLLSGEEYKVSYKKIVNCTHLNTSVPATHTPNFHIDEDAQFIPLNDLTRLSEPPAGYVVIGGGKTGIDAILWLLEQGVSPDMIQWIVSRDGWLLDRQNTQVSQEFFGNVMGTQAGQMESIAGAESIDDMFLRLEKSGYFVRLDEDIMPTMFHGATISQMELEELRKVKNIVRMGRVQRLEKEQIILDKGTIPTSLDHIHVDCSASAILVEDIKPVFDGNLITPQTVRAYQPVFSASFIAHIEATYDPDDEAKKNQICGVVPLPNSTFDYIRMTAANMMNQFNWGQDRDLRKWLLDNRLDGFSKLVAERPNDDPLKVEIMGRMKTSAMPAMMKLQEFLSEAA